MPRSRSRRATTIRARVLAEETHCYRCGHPVDTTLPGTHRWGPTTDHVHALAHGGADLDRANQRLAHMVCNSRAGGRIGGRPRADGIPRQVRQVPLAASRAW